MSIKPEYAFAILRGEKRFEFRKTLYRSANVDRVIVYASSPTKRVVGEFSIAAVHSMAPSALWKRTKKHAGVKKSFFNEYFRGREVGHALEVGELREYDEPLELPTALGLSHPPQSFRYVEDNMVVRLSLVT